MKSRIIQKFQTFLEQNLFGVCDWLGSKLGIKTSKIRLYFIYLTFLTLGSPIIIYLFIAFWLEHKNIFSKKNRSVWDL